MKGLLCILLPVTMAMVSTAEASSLYFEANPAVIKPVLSKKLQMRCSVSNRTLALINFYKGLYKESSTKGASVNGSTEDRQHDVGHLMSIVITKWNKETDQNETVASVAGCLAAGAEFNFLGKVEVEGTTEMSPVSGEVGYLQLMWDRPLDQHSGLYSCEASALTTEKHSFSLNASLQIVAQEPTISDLVTYISEHDKNITSLKEEIKNLTSLKEENKKLKLDLKALMSNTSQNFTELEKKMALIKGQNIQTGSVTCSAQTVYFSRYFNNTPVVYVAIESLSINNDNGYFSSSMSTSAVSVQSFQLSCTGSDDTYMYSLSVRWLAIG